MLSQLLIEGERACFRRPEIVEDLVTYDVIPPFTVERMLAILSPDRPIAATSISILKPLTKSWFSLTTSRGVRRCQVLNDVAYLIYVEGARSSELAAAAAGKVVHLGLSDLPARARLLSGEPPISALAGTGARDLGWLPYSHQTAPRRINYANVTMVDGVIDLTSMAEGELVR